MRPKASSLHCRLAQIRADEQAIALLDASGWKALLWLRVPCAGIPLLRGAVPAAAHPTGLQFDFLTAADELAGS